MSDKSDKRQINVTGLDEDQPGLKRGMTSAKGLATQMLGLNKYGKDNSGPASSRTVEMVINESSSEQSTVKSKMSVNLSIASAKMSKGSTPKHQEEKEEIAQVQDKYAQSHFNLNKLTRLENKKVSQIMSHELISTITKTMNEANYMGIEGRIKEVVLQAIEKPVKKMAFMEDLLHKYADSTRKNVRRVHELEFIIEKFSRESNAIENFEKRFIGLEKQLKTNAIVYDEKIRQLHVELFDNLPGRFEKFDVEIQNINRWFLQMQRNFDDIKIKNIEEQSKLMVVLRGNQQTTLKNLEELHKNQLQLDKDGSILRARINDQNDSLSTTESGIQLCNLQMNRLREDMNHDLGRLTTRIEQAEHDRMEKYYRQVSELQQDLENHKPLIKDSQTMTKSLAHHFCQDNINQTLNLISETLLGSLEGKQLNNFITFMSDRQDQIGKKKLLMLNNSNADKLKISIRHLNKQQPFYPLPAPVPEDQLQSDVAKAMLMMTDQMKQMQAQGRALANMPVDTPQPLNRVRSEHIGQGEYKKHNTKIKNKKSSQMSSEMNSSKLSKFRKTLVPKDFKRMDLDENSQQKQINVGAMDYSDTENQAKKVDETQSVEQSSVLKGTIEQNESPDNSPKKKTAMNNMMDALQSRTIREQKATSEAEKVMAKSSSTKSIIKSHPSSKVPLPLSSQNTPNKKKNVITFADEPRHSIEIDQVPNARMKSVPSQKRQFRQNLRQTEMLPILNKKDRFSLAVPPSVLKLKTQGSKLNRSLTNESQDSAYHRGNLQIANPDDDHMSDRSMRQERQVSKRDKKKEKRELAAESSSFEQSSKSSTRSRMVITSDKGRISIRVDSEVTKSNEKDKKKKKKRKRKQSSSSSSSQGLETDSDCTSDDAKGGKFIDDKQRELITEVSKGLRVQWKEEDKLVYAQKKDVFSEVQKQEIKIDEASTRAKQIQQLLMDHEKEANINNKQFTANINAHDLRFNKQDSTINQNFGTLRQYKKEIDEQIKDLELKYNKKMERQFQDFVLKVDGELTRRNRNRIEFLARFEQNEMQIGEIQAQVRKFDSTVNQMLGSVKKLMYTNDIQTSLNIQDELDKEWVSLFGRIDERTGMHTVDDLKDTTGSNREKSHYTMNAQCMSCTGNHLQKINLFKLACISYQANPVYYQGKSIARKELISLQKLVSEMAKQSLESTGNMLVKPLIYTRNSLLNQADLTTDNGPTLHEQSDATVSVGNQVLQDLEENAGLSPERTQPGVDPPDSILETQNMNQDINIQDQSNTANLTEQRHNQLTELGERQARNLLFDLNFQDDDLKQFSLIRAQQQNIYQNIFKNHNRAGNIISQNLSSSNQKQNSIHKRRAHSQLSNFNTQAYLPGMLNDSANFNRGETPGLQSFISEDHHSVEQQQDATNRFNYQTQNTSRDRYTYDSSRSKMVLPTAIIQVGSQSFRDPLLGQHMNNNGNTNSNYEGNNFNVMVQGHTATTQQMQQQLKSRQLQPISSSLGGKKRTNFRITSQSASTANKDQHHRRRPASVNQNSFNPHSQLRSRKVSQNNNSSLMHNIQHKINGTVTNANANVNINRVDIRSSLNKDQPSFIVASGDGQQNNQQQRTNIPTLTNAKKKKTSIMMSLVSSKNGTRMSSAQKFETKESKDESSEQNKDFNIINHNDDEDAVDSGNDQGGEKLIKVQLPQVF